MTTHFNPASCPSPSALRVAASRALHQLLDTQRVFDDPFAIGILGAATAAQLMLDPDAHNDVTARSMRAGMVARSRFAEDRVLRAIAAGVQQYVIVGAGLDTWALRHAQTLPSVEVFELDQPAMQQWKQQMLLANGWHLHPRLHWVPVDLREQAALQDPQRLGWSRSSPSVISMLGVLVYLHQHEVAHSLQRLRALPAGSVLPARRPVPATSGAQHDAVHRPDDGGRRRALAVCAHPGWHAPVAGRGGFYRGRRSWSARAEYVLLRTPP